MPIFESGKVLNTSKGEKVKIVKFIAAGGQGEVYLVDYKGQQKALKWYTNAGSNPGAFYDNLERNVKNGSPDKAFLWPEAIMEKSNNSFGYIMGLRPKEYSELSDFMTARVKFPSFKAAVEACFNIVSAFRILHNNGYSYQDLNDGNFFINPKTGEVLICDNDNVAPNRSNTGVMGKPRYMAPEIVTHQAEPNTQSDRFSLAVIIFILLCNDHPFEGKRVVNIPCLVPQLAEKVYGSEAVFIYDRENKSNPPAPCQTNVIGRWRYLPKYMKEAFMDALGQDAVHHADKRYLELDWLKVLTRFKSDIVKCSCGNELFIDETVETVCEKCRRKYQVENWFQLPKYKIVATKGSWVYRCQLGVCNANDALSPIIHVVTTKDGKLVFKNETGIKIKAINSKGEPKTVEPDAFVPVKTGISIEVYDKKIEII